MFQRHRFTLTAASCLMLASIAAWAGSDPPSALGEKKADAGVVSKTPAVLTMAEGEVRKLDKDAKKITLKHGEIKNLDMPPMTMVFQVPNAALLDKVKVGDKVRFKADKAGAGYAVTEIEVAK